MRSTGIVRKIDELGRIVLPMELRKSLEIAEKDDLEIFVDGSSILLKKHEPQCIFCGCTTEISSFKGKNICNGCRNDIRK